MALCTSKARCFDSFLTYLVDVSEQTADAGLSLEKIGNLQLVVRKRVVFLDLFHHNLLLYLHIAYGAPHRRHRRPNLLLAPHLQQQRRKSRDLKQHFVTRLLHACNACSTFEKRSLSTCSARWYLRTMLQKHTAGRMRRTSGSCGGACRPTSAAAWKACGSCAPSCGAAERNISEIRFLQQTGTSKAALGYDCLASMC